MLLSVEIQLMKGGCHRHDTSKINDLVTQNRFSYERTEFKFWCWIREHRRSQLRGHEEQDCNENSHHHDMGERREGDFNFCHTNFGGIREPMELGITYRIISRPITMVCIYLIQVKVFIVKYEDPM